MNRRLLWTGLVLSLLLMGAPALAQGGDRAQAASNLARSAFQLYRQGIEQQDLGLFWDAVDTLATLFERYPESTLARDNYLAATEILCKKIGTPEAYDAAQELFEHYLRAYSDPLKSPGQVDPLQVREMHLALVSFFYTYRHAYTLAAQEMNRFYQDHREVLTPPEQVRARLLEARIQRKMGDFAAARRAYGLAEQAGRTGQGSVSFQTQMRFCEAAEGAKRYGFGPHTLHVIGTLPQATLDQLMAQLDETLTEQPLELATDPHIPLDIFVFATAEQLQHLTGQAGPYVLALDGEICLLPGTNPAPLLAQVIALGWRIRPVDEVPAVLAEGLPSRIALGEAAWRDAAGPRALLGNAFTPDVLLDPDNYRTLPDRGALAAAFVSLLIQRGGMARFGRLYGNWEVLRRQSEEPLRFSEIEAGRGGDTFDLEGMARAYRSIMGEDLETVWREFGRKLEAAAKDTEAEFRQRTGGLKSITVDDSTPEAAVRSWVKAMQAGDLAALETLAAKPLKEELKSTWQLYRDAGALEAMRLWVLAIPYSRLSPEVADVRTLGPAQSQVVLLLKERGTEVRRAELLVWQEGGKWRLASGL